MSVPKGIRLSNSLCLHLLKIHGSDLSLIIPGEKEPVRVLDILCNDRIGTKYFGLAPLVISRSMPAVRQDLNRNRDTPDDRAAEAHPDQFLSVMFEIGLPLSYPVSIKGKGYRLADLLNGSLAEFHLDRELEWSGMAYALGIAPSERRWRNRFGEEFSFDDLVEVLLKPPGPKTSCGGIHALQAIAMICCVNDESPILSDATRRRAQKLLKRAVLVAASTQQADGSWVPRWNEAIYDGRPATYQTFSISPDVENRLLLTGHIGDWLTVLPRSIAVDESIFARATPWLLRTLRNQQDGDFWRLFCHDTHAYLYLRSRIGATGAR